MALNSNPTGYVVQRVKSNDGSQEGWWVFITIVAILLCAGAALISRHYLDSHDTSSSLSHQRSIVDLTDKEKAMVMELRLAHQEIIALFEESEHSQWPTVDELQEWFISPFHHDAAWEFRGKHQWYSMNDGTYVGVAENTDGVSHLVLFSQNDQADIWLASDLVPNMSGFIRHLTSENEHSEHHDINQRHLAEQGWHQLTP